MVRLSPLSSHLATPAPARLHRHVVARLLPQVHLLDGEGYGNNANSDTHLLFVAPLLATLPSILQLAEEGQEIVLPHLKAIRVHEPRDEDESYPLL